MDAIELAPIEGAPNAPGPSPVYRVEPTGDTALESRDQAVTADGGKGSRQVVVKQEVGICTKIAFIGWLTGITVATLTLIAIVDGIKSGQLSTMSTQLTGFKTILERVKGEVQGIKSGQMEEMDRIKRIEKYTFNSEIDYAKTLVPKELEGLVDFKTFPSTGNLYALVKKNVDFQGAEVTQLQTAAMMTEMKF